MRSGRRRAYAMLLSLAAHAGLLGVLAWRLTATRPVAEPKVMQVALVPRPTTPRRARPADNPRPDRPARAVPHAPPATATGVEPVQVPAQAAAPDDRGQKVLRGLLACRNADVLRLPRDERQKCQERAAALAANAAEPKLKLDKGFVADRDQEDILIRKPVDGCRLRAAGDKPNPFGGQKGVTAGVGCSWRF